MPTLVLHLQFICPTCARSLVTVLSTSFVTQSIGPLEGVLPLSQVLAASKGGKLQGEQSRMAKLLP